MKIYKNVIANTQLQSYLIVLIALSKTKMDATPLVFAILSFKNDAVLSQAKQKELSELIRINSYQSVDSILNACFRQESIRVVQISPAQTPNVKDNTVAFYIPSILVVPSSLSTGLNTYFADAPTPERAYTCAVAKIRDTTVLFTSDARPQTLLPDWAPPSDQYTQVSLHVSTKHI